MAQKTGNAMQNPNHPSVDYYQIQCADCRNTFVWRQAYWQSNTPGSLDGAGYDFVSRAFCPHCGSIVCEGIGSSYWKWVGANQLFNANNPLPPTLPPDLEWIPDNENGAKFMQEFHEKWGKRRLPKELQVPVSQQRLDLSFVRDFNEALFRPIRVRTSLGFFEKLRKFLPRWKRERKGDSLQNAPEKSYPIDPLQSIGALSQQDQDDLSSVYLPESWFPTAPEERAALWNELQKELPVGHVLYHTPVMVIATQNYVNDNILCRHLNEPDRFTVVNLTWSGKTEVHEKFPAVELDGSFEDFLSYEIASSKVERSAD